MNWPVLRDRPFFLACSRGAADHGTASAPTLIVSAQ
jgi:hypothetical protein